MLLNAHRPAVASQNISITSLTSYKKEIKRLTLTRLCEDECFFLSKSCIRLRYQGNGDNQNHTHTFTNPICSSKFQLCHRFNEHGKCGYMVAPRCSSLCAQEKCHIGNERFTLGFRGNKFFQLTAS